jgi:hypothetical protein
MDFVEEYTEKWVQREEVELDILSEWVNSLRSLILSQTKKTYILGEN